MRAPGENCLDSKDLPLLATGALRQTGYPFSSSVSSLVKWNLCELLMNKGLEGLALYNCLWINA